MNGTARFIVSLEGLQISEIEKKLLRHPYVAAVLIFSRNFSSKEQLLKLIASIQKYSSKNDTPIFVDQEGGQIQRLSGHGFESLPSFASLGKATATQEYSLASLDKITAAATTMCNDLKPYGIINLTPVVDLNKGNKVISGKDRSFHENGKIASKIAAAYIEGMLAAGHSATLKHFPGHGNCYQDGMDDSHFCQPIDNRDLPQIMQHDIIPFKELASKAAAIMPSHIVFPKIDAKNPVGFSKTWLQDILRKQLKFEGIIVSDCLSMAGAGDKPMLEKAKKALEWADIVIMANVTAIDVLDIFNGIDIAPLSIKQQENFILWTNFGRISRMDIAINYN